MNRRRVHRIMSSALRRAVEQQVIARNPCDLFRKRLQKSCVVVTLTSQQSAFRLDALRDNPMYWPVLIVLATWARRGEVLALR